MLAANDYAIRWANNRPQSKSNAVRAVVYPVQLKAVQLNSTEISNEVRSPENCCANSKDGKQSPTVHSNINVELPPQNVCVMPIVLPLSDEIVMLSRHIERLQDSLSRLPFQQRPLGTVRCNVCHRIGHTRTNAG